MLNRHIIPGVLRISLHSRLVYAHVHVLSVILLVLKLIGVRVMPEVETVNNIFDRIPYDEHLLLCSEQENEVLSRRL